VSIRIKVAPLLAVSFLLVGPLAAQVKTGNFTNALSGTIAPGYAATYSNQSASTHSWAIAGTGTLTGSYYSPNFLSYGVNYYLNQSRANSNFQSITNASGFDISTGIFNGSHYPGAITYSKAYNSEGNYAIPGQANFVTHGNSDSFGINWSETLPDKPTVSAGFQMGSSDYTVYGTNDTGNTHFRSGNVHSSYNLGGYSLGGFYSIGDSNSLVPQVIVGAASPETHTNDHAYGFNVSHKLPLQGSIVGGYTRSVFGTDYLGASTSGTIDMLNVVGTVRPLNRVSITGGANYSDNLSGQFIQSIVGTSSSTQASVPNIFDSHQSSSALDLNGVASYAPTDNSQVSVSVDRRQQELLGVSYGMTSYGASGNYTRRLFEGNLNSAVSMNANTSDNSGGDTLGFTISEGYSTKVAGWHLNGNFNYAQNAQTLLVTYMNSFYNYSGNARRSWGKLNFSASAGGSHTALTDQPGTANSSKSYSSSIGYTKFLNLSGGYSESSGQALITGSGLVPVPVPPIVPSSLVSMYGGSSYAFSAASAPARNLLLQASWSRAFSNTETTDAAGDLISSSNRNGQFDTRIQYQYRKLSFNAGFARLEQGFSQSALPAEIVSSYYMGVSRWFKFF
jgi:hypothetical protein